MPQSHGCGGFCGGQICQQVGIPFPGLCYYLNCLHLCWGNKIHDASTKIPVSAVKTDMSEKEVEGSVKRLNIYLTSCVCNEKSKCYFLALFYM